MTSHHFLSHLVRISLLDPCTHLMVHGATWETPSTYFHMLTSMNLTHFHPDRNSTMKFDSMKLPDISLGILIDVGLGLHCQGSLL